jgi:hypothetical protein
MQRDKEYTTKGQIMFHGWFLYNKVYIISLLYVIMEFFQQL